MNNLQDFQKRTEADKGVQQRQKGMTKSKRKSKGMIGGAWKQQNLRTCEIFIKAVWWWVVTWSSEGNRRDWEERQIMSMERDTPMLYDTDGGTRTVKAQTHSQIQMCSDRGANCYGHMHATLYIVITKRHQKLFNVQTCKFHCRWCIGQTICFI